MQRRSGGRPRCLAAAAARDRPPRHGARCIASPPPGLPGATQSPCFLLPAGRLSAPRGGDVVSIDQ